MITTIYELDPAHFLSASGLAWQACLKKKTEVELNLLTDIDMLFFSFNCDSLHARLNSHYNA